MLFSEHYKIKEVEKENWFDPILEVDTRLFIDPILLFKTKIPEFANSKDKIKKFFQYAFEKVAKARKKGIGELEKINPLLSFKEPKEILLGYTYEGSSGRGLGPDFARQIRDAIVDFIDYGLEDLAAYVGTFELLVEGIGPDGISDMITNIIKEDLVEYTQRICNQKGIIMNDMLVINLGYDIELGMWKREKVALPKNPSTSNPIILVPKSFLRANESINIFDLGYYLARIENGELRKEATRLFTKDLNIQEIKSAFNRDPITAKKIIKSFLEDLEKSDIAPYSLDFDPELLYKFELFIKEEKKRLIKKETPTKNKESLKNFVQEVILQYKKIIEKRENYWLLYDDKDNPKPENTCQRLFWAISDTMCSMNGEVVVNRENPTGRGPVDFKFSQGYRNKIVVELKHVRSSQIFKGIEKQLPTYIDSEESDFGYYIVLKLLPSDTARFYRLTDRFEKLNSELKSKIFIIDIDARIDNKQSASKIR